MTSDQSVLVGLLASRYIQRRDVKAKQFPSGAYNPIKSRFTKRDLRLHLEHRVTFGHYLIDQDGLCRTLCFDIDFDDEFIWGSKSLNPREIFGTDHPARGALVMRIRSMADGLAFALKRRHPELHVVCSYSGSKGIHVLGSFGEGVPAASVREIGHDLLDWFGCFQLHLGKNFYKHSMGAGEGLTLEVYPKQDTVGQDGYGNLLRLPLGIHQKSGRKSFFYDPRSDNSLLREIDPVMALTFGLTL